jgi:hypothetical protein
MALIFSVYLNTFIKIKIVYLLWCFLITSCSVANVIIINTGIAKVFGHSNLVLTFGMIQICSVNYLFKTLFKS